MQMDDGKFLAWATGTIVALFGAMFGSYRFTQNQLDKHKESTSKDLAAHKAEVHAADCVSGKSCKEDREHLADHMKRTTKQIEGMSKAIFDEIKSLNDKLFEIVKDKG